MDGGSANDYDYASGDPVNRFDLAGTCVVTPIDAAACTGGAIAGPPGALVGAAGAAVVVGGGYLLSKAAGKLFKRKSPSKKVKQEIRDRDGNVCQNCGGATQTPQQSEKGVSPPGNESNIDHKLPVSKGGTREPDNLQNLCRTCNLEKSDKYPYP